MMPTLFSFLVTFSIHTHFQSAMNTDPKLDARLDKLHTARSDAEHPDNPKIQPFRLLTST